MSSLRPGTGLRRLDAPRRRRCLRLLLRQGGTIQAETGDPVAEERGDRGAVVDERAARQRGEERAAVARVRRRGSRIATTPRSPWPRISRPKPCRSCSIAVGQRVVAEPVAAGRLDRLAARLVQRVARRRERQLVDHEQRERLARDVDALPERRRREQHRVDLVAEALEQPLARRLALHEHLVRDARRGRGRAARRARGSST